MNERLMLFPQGSHFNHSDHLVIDGSDVVALAKEYGTPLYLFSEATIRHSCREFKSEFGSRYSPLTVAYAGKACLTRPVLEIIKDEGLYLDVVSGGEMAIARASGFDPAKIYFHGNNKSDVELKYALEWGVRRIVVDNAFEHERLTAMTASMNMVQPILLRVSPGIDPHTHARIATGNVDSKFGFTLTDSEKVVELALKSKNIDLKGFHFHLGSMLFETEPYTEAIEVMI